MKHIHAFWVGMLFGLFAGLVVFVGPLSPGSVPARIYYIEEKPLRWVDSQLIRLLHIDETGVLSLILSVLLAGLHFVLWGFLGGLLFWAGAGLLSKASHHQ